MVAQSFVCLIRLPRLKGSLMTLAIDPSVFADSAIDGETRALNRRIVETFAGWPDPWAFPPAVIREARKQGRGIFPVKPASARAESLDIPGPRGPINLRILHPKTKTLGVYLHLHFGGWTLGSNDMHDWLFERIADTTGLAVVSVDYKLAPEFPYPAGPDDCEHAALWLTREAGERFGTDILLIGGESAGAHLSVVTMVRLRDRHGLKPFRAAVLTAGSYDLTLTPSAKNWGLEKLILNTRDIENFARCYVPVGIALNHPDVSPFYADLGGLPPALFSVGTKDPLLDDSMFMATRWLSAGNKADLAIYPGGCHVFHMFEGRLSEMCLTRLTHFMAQVIA